MDSSILGQYIKLVISFIGKAIYFNVFLRLQPAEPLKTLNARNDFRSLVNELPTLLATQLKCELKKSDYFNRCLVVGESGNTTNSKANISKPHVVTVEGAALPRGQTDLEAIVELKQVVGAALLPIIEELEVQGVQWLTPRGVKPASPSRANR